VSRRTQIGCLIPFVAMYAGSFAGLAYVGRALVYDFRPADAATLKREPAVVEEADEYAVTVRYDDGRRETNIGSVGSNYPERGLRVLLERWDGRFVSVYDPRTRHRYRGTGWPGVLSEDQVMGLVAATVVLLPIAGSLVLGTVYRSWLWLRRRL
jgi:hypothetical protein